MTGPNSAVAESACVWRLEFCAALELKIEAKVHAYVVGRRPQVPTPRCAHRGWCLHRLTQNATSIGKPGHNSRQSKAPWQREVWARRRESKVHTHLYDECRQAATDGRPRLCFALGLLLSPDPELTPREIAVGSWRAGHRQASVNWFYSAHKASQYAHSQVAGKQGPRRWKRQHFELCGANHETGESAMPFAGSDLPQSKRWWWCRFASCGCGLCPLQRVKIRSACSPLSKHRGLLWHCLRTAKPKGLQQDSSQCCGSW